MIFVGESSLLERGSPCIRLVNNGLYAVYIVDSCWHTPLLLIGNLTDGATENLATSRLWQLLHDDHTDQSRKGTNVSSNLVVNFLLQLDDLIFSHL